MNKEFEVNGVKYLAVEMPESARHIEIDGHVLMYDVFEYGRPAFKCKVLPIGVWEIVGLVGDKISIGTVASRYNWEMYKYIHNLNDNHLILKEI